MTDPERLLERPRAAEGRSGRPAPVPPELARRGVFESILVQGGRPLRRADHLTRLARSVRELYVADPPADLGLRVAAAAESVRAEPRAAVTVWARPGATGLDVTVTARPMGPRLPSCSLALAARPEHSWRHKWSDRAELLAAEASVAPALPYFLDPSGRLAETSRGNLFVRGRDGVWRTPPATDWILPGVTRRAVLDALGERGIPVEIAAMTADDLRRATSAVWTSSLSGAVRVSSVDGQPLSARSTPLCQ